MTVALEPGVEVRGVLANFGVGDAQFLESALARPAREQRGKPGQEMRNVALRWLVAFVGHFVALHRPLYGTSRRNRRAMGHNPVDISKLGSRCHSVSKDCRSRSIRAQKFGNSIGWRLGSMPLRD